MCKSFGSDFGYSINFFNSSGSGFSSPKIVGFHEKVSTCSQKVPVIKSLLNNKRNYLLFSIKQGWI